ncbi:MAG: glutathione S-transferase family protein [Sandaracinaceae bacterium]
MKLYVTPASPYCTLVRAFLFEKGLDERVELATATTRVADSPYYATNVSGRVPYLQLDDGRGLEDSRLIIEYLDSLEGEPLVAPPCADGFESGRLEALARSFLDGLAVWRRELRRPDGERSPTVIAHEAARAERLADAWERELAHPLLDPSRFHLAAFTLAIAIDYARRTFGWDACADRPALRAWMDAKRARPSIARATPA